MTQQRGTYGAAYLRAKVGKHTCDCLLDTGSVLIPASIVKGEDIRDTTQTVSAANGTDIAILGEVSLPLSVGKFSGTISGLVSEDVGEVMLGIGWMEDNAVTWEFDSSRVKIGQRYYALKRGSNIRSWCRSVFLRTDVVIPPRAEVDLPTAVVMRRLPRSSSMDEVQWGTEPGPVVPGVHVCRTLIPGDRLANIPFRVMNVRAEEVVFKAGTNVANLQPVTVLGTIPGKGTVEAESTQVKVVESERETPQFVEELVDSVHESVPDS